MSNKQFLTQYLKGGNNVIIRKKDGGLTKAQFTKQLLADPKVVSQVGVIKDKHNVKGNGFTNHPDAKKINADMKALVESHAADKVSVVAVGEPETRSPAPPPPKDYGRPDNLPDIPSASGWKMPKQPNRVVSKPTVGERMLAGQGDTRGTTADVREAYTDEMDFFRDTVRYEIDRMLTGDYYAWDQPEKFSDWDPDPAKADIQKKFVDEFEKKALAGEFVNYTTAQGSGLKEIEIADVIAEEIITSSGLAEGMGFQAVNKAGMATISDEQREKIITGGIANLINEMQKQYKATPTNMPPLKLQPTTNMPPLNLVHRPTQSTQIHGEQVTGHGDTTTQLAFGPGEGQRQISDTGGAQPEGQPPTGGGPIWIPKPIKPEEKKKDEPKPPVEDEKEKDKKKPRRPKFPEPESEDEESEPEDEPEVKPGTSEPTIHPYGMSELRPYFKAGGEDMLRISNARKKQEITDWALYSFVPGYVNDGDDNPLTQLNKNQYAYRMQNTDPEPIMVKPRLFSGRAPTSIMRNIYQRNQPFFDQSDRRQWCGRTMNQDQSRRVSSDVLALGNQGYMHPDLNQMRFPNGRDENINVQRSLMGASKTMM